jgi:hypothetical protein
MMASTPLPFVTSHNVLYTCHIPASVIPMAPDVSLMTHWQEAQGVWNARFCVRVV